MKTMKKINIGCGIIKKKGYINIDFNPDLKPDLVWKIGEKPLPYKNDSLDEINADAVIEHLDTGFIEFIIEAKRLLKPNGILKFSVPNCFHWMARIKYLFGIFDASSGFHYDHRWLFKPSFCVKTLEFFGFQVKSKHSDLFDSNMNFIARKRA